MENVNNQENSDILTGIIYQETLTAMKKILDLGEFKIGAANSKEYLYFKREVMDSFYTSLRNIYRNLEEEDIVKKCDMCDADLRKGWKPCACRGSGYLSR